MLLFNGLIGDLLSQNALTDLHQIFKIGTLIDGHDQFDFFRDRSRDIAVVTVFWRQSANIGIFRLHSVRWHSTTGKRIATWMRALTSPITSLHLVKVW